MKQTVQEKACIEAWVEYKEWREYPQWYCVKTTLSNNGAVKSEIYKDEKTKLPIVIQSIEKPQDAVWETATETTYYSYHEGYKAAARQVAAAL